MAKPITIRLPLSGIKDHDQVLDEFGNIFEFDTEARTWIYKGIVQTPPIVTDEKSGLVSPQIFEKLRLIDLLVKRGFKFDSFKIDSGSLRPYFYFFHSSDDLIRFYPESQNKLRIELDRARLIARMTSQCCIGPKGKRGLQGQPGRDGKPADNETFKTPKFAADGVFEFETVVATPLDTPISVRIFRDVSQLAELLVPIAGSDDLIINVSDEGPEIELSSLDIKYDAISKVLSGYVKFISGADDISEWRYKARQRGPKGDDGNDGSEFFEIIDQFFDDPLLRSAEAIVSLRKPTTSNNVFFIKKPLFDETCSFNLIPSGQPPRGKIEQASIVAVRVTPKNCKDIGSFKFVAPEFDAPVLDLPAWTPTVDCCDHCFANVRDFDWFDRVDPKYIFKIEVDPCMPEMCCQEDFFLCPNLGDTPCGISGSIQPPPRPNIERPPRTPVPPAPPFRPPGGGSGSTGGIPPDGPGRPGSDEEPGQPVRPSPRPTPTEPVNPLPPVLPPTPTVDNRVFVPYTQSTQTQPGPATPGTEPIQRVLTWSVNIISHFPPPIVSPTPQITRFPLGSNLTSPSVLGTSNYDDGTSVAIVASVPAGYVFAGWTGPVAAPGSASTSTLMSADATIMANLVQLIFLP